MLVLGVVLILLAVAAAIAATVNEPTVSTTITVFDRAYEVTATQMFVLGVITAALFLLGVALLLKGARRAGNRRRELRHARLEARERVARLEEEKRALQRRLESASPAAEPAPTERTVPMREPTAEGPPAAAREAGHADRDVHGTAPAHRPTDPPTGPPAGAPVKDEPAPATRPRRFVDRLVAGNRRDDTPRR